MELLQLRTNVYHQIEEKVPFSVYTVGTENQLALTRLKGFSAKQLFMTFSGTGAFRSLEQDEWDILSPNTLLYIPSGYPHEYLPQGQSPWFVGYVSFVEKYDTLLHSWGFGDTPFQLSLQHAEPFYEHLERIWLNSGPHYEVWRSTEYFFSMCVEIKRQQALSSTNRTKPSESVTFMRYRDSVVDSAVRFLHDHLQRNVTMTELSSYVGYSPKQLNRLFQQSLHLTPLQYLQKIRLNTAALLLKEQPNMTVRQVAAYIGMEPVYFTRLFKRFHHTLPSEIRNRQL